MLLFVQLVSVSCFYRLTERERRRQKHILADGIRHKQTKKFQMEEFFIGEKSIETLLRHLRSSSNGI